MWGVNLATRAPIPALTILLILTSGKLINTLAHLRKLSHHSPHCSVRNKRYVVKLTCQIKTRTEEVSTYQHCSMQSKRCVVEPTRCFGYKVAFSRYKLLSRVSSIGRYRAIRLLESMNGF